MNQKNSDIETREIADDRALERLLDSCEFSPVNTDRIKMLVHEKIREQKAQRRRRLRRLMAGALSAAACVAIVLVYTLRFSAPTIQSISNSTELLLAQAGYTEVIVPAGQRQEIILPDGSRLIANSLTKVVYPDKFDGKERRILTDGEVYLEVAKDASHPFIVESKGFDVRVLGTKFNVCNTSDSTASVVLVEGSVRIDMNDDRTIRLKPSDKADLLNGEVTSLTQVDTDDYTSWTNGILVLKGIPLSKLAEDLSNYYGIDINCHKSLANVKVYGKLDLHNNVDSVMETIREIVPMKTTRNGNGISLQP